MNKLLTPEWDINSYENVLHVHVYPVVLVKLSRGVKQTQKKVS